MKSTLIMSGHRILRYILCHSKANETKNFDSFLSFLELTVVLLLLGVAGAADEFNPGPTFGRRR